MRCTDDFRRYGIFLLVVLFLLSISLVFAITITDDTQAEFQNGTFSNTTSNSTGVYLDSSELTSDANTVDLLHFNENTSNKTFGVNNRVNFTFYANTNWTNNSKFGNSSITFDGDGDYAEADQHFLTIANATVEFWFKLGESHNNGGGQKYLWLYHKDNNEYGRITLDNDGKLHFRFQATQLKWDLSTSQASWNANQWYHVAVMCGSDGGKLYVGGSEIGTDADTECFNDFGSSFTLYHILGADYTGGTVSNEVNVSIDELKIYNKSLSAAEVVNDFYSYFTSGTFTSDIKNATSNVSWTDIVVNWTNSSGNNVTFQVRSCDDSACSGESFIGSDNTSSTYFITNSVNLSTTNLSMNQFFQYQIFFNTNESSETPLLLNVTITHNGTEDTLAPNITIEKPTDDNSGFNSENVTFEFNVTDDGNLNNCSLYIDGVLNKSIVSPNKGKNNFNIPKLAKGKYNYTIECVDTAGRTTTTPAKNVHVILSDKFSGTDLTTVDVSNISNFLLQNTSSGSINFTEVVNLTNVDDLNTYITIESNKISINSSALSSLNKSAILKLYNLTFSDPRILRDGSVCPSTICTEISYSGSTLTFNVTQFSEYTSEETPSSSTTTPSTGGGGCTKRFEITVDPDVKINKNGGDVNITIENTGGCTLYDINASLDVPNGWTSESFIVDRLKRYGLENVTLNVIPSEFSSGKYNAAVKAKSGSKEESKEIVISVLKQDVKSALSESVGEVIETIEEEKFDENKVIDESVENLLEETTEEITDSDVGEVITNKKQSYIILFVILVSGSVIAFYNRKYLKKLLKKFKK